MTRKSKIARLPRSIRDELNHRLDNGEPGLRLVEWLNHLPEAKEILARDFRGHRITPQNLSEWRRGGYRDWLAQQERAATLQDFLADAKELGEAASPEKLTEAIFTCATVHYAAAMYESIYRPERRDNLNLWSQMLHDVIRLRNCDLARERFELDTQKLAFNTEKLEIQTQLAHLRLDLARHKVSAQLQEPPPNRSADIPVRSTVTSPQARSSSNVGAASPSPIGWERAGVRAGVQREDVPKPAGETSSDVGCAKTPLEINTLQPNPTKSNDPFFIFPQTTTVGHLALSKALPESSDGNEPKERGCLSPSFFATPKTSPAPELWNHGIRNTQHTL